MTNKSVKMTTLKTPTQMLRTRLRLTGLNNGFEVLCELKKRKKIIFSTKKLECKIYLRRELVAFLQL